MTVKRFLAKFKEMTFKPTVICADGYTVSIQNAKQHSCATNSVEIGFPNKHDEMLESYKQIKFMRQEDSIFPFVPIDVIEKVISNHGGITKIELGN